MLPAHPLLPYAFEMNPDHLPNIGLALFWISFPLLLLLATHIAKGGYTRKQTALLGGAFGFSLFGMLGYLIADHYTGVGINDAAFFQLHHGMTGLRADMWVPLAALLSVVLLSFLGILYIGWRRGSTKSRKPALLLGAACVLLNPGFVQMGALMGYAWEQARYVKDTMEGAQAPSSEPEGFRNNPRSMVHIYAEGLERLFLDETLFPGLTPNLNALRKEALEIRGIGQVTMTGWTAAGLIASQCGFPSMDGGTLIMGTLKHPCMPHLLKPANYQMTYLNGGTLEFTGKGAFWTSMGYNNVYGLHDINRLAGTPKAPMSWWGAYDDALFTAAWNEYEDLRKEPRPFVLTLLTVDTHAPHGLPTPQCKDLPTYPMAKQWPMLDQVHCADHLLGAFIRKVRAESGGEVLIVLQSDHLQTPRADVYPKLSGEQDRDNLFLAWGEGVVPQRVQRKATSFDVGPTILGLLGRNPGALNLGRDLMATEQTLMETHGRDWVEARMRAAMAIDSQKGADEVEMGRAKEAQRRSEGKEPTHMEYDVTPHKE